MTNSECLILFKKLLYQIHKLGINFKYDTQYGSSYCIRNKKTYQVTIGLNKTSNDDITEFDIFSIAHELGHYYSMRSGNWTTNFKDYKKMHKLTSTLLDDNCDILTDEDTYNLYFYLANLINEEELAWRNAKLTLYKLGIRDFNEFNKIQKYSLDSYQTYIKSVVLQSIISI